MNARTISAIQAGFGTSSNVAAMFMALILWAYVNVSHIYIYVYGPRLSRGLGLVPRRRAAGEPQPAQIEQDAGFEQLLGRHRQLARGAVAAREQGSDAVRERPDVQRHHQRRRPLVLGQPSAQH